MEGVSRGVLYPARLPTFQRVLPPPALESLVRWFWIPEWDLPSGRVSRQELLPFPACNLAVEPGFVGLAGPTTRRTVRDLRGCGWTVGALRRPAAVEHLTSSPSGIRDTYRVFDGAGLHSAVAAAMNSRREGELRRSRAVGAFSAWITGHLPPPSPEGLAANQMADLIESTAPITRVDQVSERLGVSVRTVQRLAHRHVGLSPAVMIRRRRLQGAAELLRTTTDTTIAQIANDLGYADQAHLHADFRTLLGITPGRYAREAADDLDPALRDS